MFVTLFQWIESAVPIQERWSMQNVLLIFIIAHIRLAFIWPMPAMLDTQAADSSFVRPMDNGPNQYQLVLLQIFISSSNFFITARKRSLGQGNMFTGVCLSTWGVPAPGVPALGECLILGVPGLGRCLLLGGCLLRWVWSKGDACSQRVCLVETPPPDGHCCGRYESYWNAVLYFNSKQ